MTEPRHPAGLPRADRILVAEDDAAMRDLLVGWLREAGYDVTECGSGFELLSILEMSVLSGELPEFDAVLSDVFMPQGNAVDALEELLGCDGVPPTILITAFGNPRIRVAAHRLGAARVLEKPLDRERLLGELRGLRGAPRPAGS